MFLSKTASLPAPRSAERPSLEKLSGMLPSPMRPLDGRKAAPFALPDNIICFSRRSAADLNHPQQGRALHHRFVLIFALETSATVRVDDRDVHLAENHGLIIFPFQFHDYIDQASEKLNWLFITFDLPDDGSLAPMRYHAFGVTPEVRRAASELVAAYLYPGVSPEPGDVMITLQLSLLLQHIWRANPAARKNTTPVAAAPGLVTRVNQLTEGKMQLPNVKELASALGISASHLRTRFRESCGVSLGKHLRRLRLEKARGLLRLSTRRVNEISDLCGFSSVYTFSRAFHTLYGLAPLEYRKGGSIRPRGKRRKPEEAIANADAGLDGVAPLV